MAARVIGDDPALAHEHAQAAMRHAGRVAVARETLAITAYAVEDFALALRELRTLRRITGSNEHVALIVDAERGVGRPEKGIEEGNAADRSSLSRGQRVELAIAMSGARLDLGQTQLALAELEIDDVDPDTAYSWSAGLFAARAAVLEDLGLADEAAEWDRRAQIAADAIEHERARDDEILVEEIPEIDLPDDDTPDDAAPGASAHEDGEQPSDVVEASHESEDTAVESDGSEAEDDGQDADGAETPNAHADEPTAPDDGHGPADVTVEDEVAEILIEAGVDEPGDGESTSERPAARNDEEDDRPDGALF